ncbi:uncharacterized protein TNCV_1367631 [Trichonephila clavipes]|nr:uncharacterized protein TNCV_1367631 [Trichonephila clavipes]
MLNVDELVTSGQEESDPVNDETDKDEDNNNNESSKVHEILTRFLQFNAVASLTIDAAAITNTLLFTLVYVSLSAYYGLACFYITALCRQTNAQVKNVKKICECNPIIHKYLKIRDIMVTLEHFMSSSAFLVVMGSMTGLFWFSYKMIFFIKDGYQNYIGLMAGEMFQLSIFGMMIISASSVNRAADVAKEAVMSLPGRVPQYYNELKVILRKECKQNVCLTLWKIYKIDNSLIISALGVLMSYGFLIATFGTISSHTDK